MIHVALRYVRQTLGFCKHLPEQFCKLPRFPGFEFAALRSKIFAAAASMNS